MFYKCVPHLTVEGVEWPLVIVAGMFVVSDILLNPYASGG